MAGDQDRWRALGVDVELPSAARVYDAYLGGAHNFAADRAFFARAKEKLPHIADVARWNRTFLRRAVQTMAEEGIDQFLDIGSGLPTAGNTHEIAHRTNPDARVVYADNEPVAVVQTEELLKDVPGTAVVRGDFLEPDAILGAAATRELLDLTKPVGVLAVALLHFIPREQHPEAALERYKDALPAGSRLAISHATVDGVAEPVRSQTLDFIDSYKDTQNPGFTARDELEFRRFFTGWELLDPGVAFTSEWRSDLTDVDDFATANPKNAVCFAAVARKP
ncbi:MULTISPECIES: SAM-dependent methyltransferase [unclassified Saccharopolyspora]|uniref:SAM-dependent methyltransferase n=1 Tax=unclassified Saccharopolyspora TaxID=2646250 RepID=UPI001CD3C51D|nr:MULTISPECIES: SAM-dependent methyltransferase [unclassified Saccharopolyspora]MCA1190431.1 SAM-dependent methyltransferase [Saccharopolyspora sp. 6T]MCA1195756.1 SAM-dependent methyltransferase [Saccharopolyspora sp. 6V]MCA1229907.1 SAM-dependent methyltransferase [Saccharopolyspora sp. 6M]MCA1281890.1 SAM-dependent methyltransferase [Saccharopolyspora sp. 7B]